MIASTSAAVMRCTRAGCSVVLSATTSSRVASTSRTFSSRASATKQAANYFVATLPWADSHAAGEHFSTTARSARFDQGEGIIASSITTCKRSSPIASSLKAKLDSLNISSHHGGGAWLLLRASDTAHAQQIVQESCGAGLANDGTPLFDLNRANLQSIDLGEDPGLQGPLYSPQSATVIAPPPPPLEVFGTFGPLYGK